MTNVYFVGAGPGDPELITVRGMKLLEKADIIIYAGSLVNPKLLEYNRKGAVCHNSAGMTLDEVITVMKEGAAASKMTVRLHTGDPSLYGAIKEQMESLDKLEITYQVIPGVSSFSAAAAALNAEFTLPGVSQSLICTRLEGRTPVPPFESLDRFAEHQCSMALFLSVHMIEPVVEKLCTHYPASTPVAVIEKASWPDQRIIKGTLETIAAQVKETAIRKTAQILVGKFLDTDFEKSKLYDPSFSHEYRSNK